MGGSLVWAVIAIAIYFLSASESWKQAAYIIGLVSLAWFMLALWDLDDLAKLPVAGQALDERLSGDILGSLPPRQPLTPQTVWDALETLADDIYM